MDTWTTHSWLDAAGRSLNLNGQWKREFFCIRCRRHFVEIVESGRRFAAFPSAFDFDPLAQHITERWLAEPCPGEPQESDAAACRERPLRV